jgi:hypothetical protein
MAEGDRRKALREQYRQTPPAAGVYRILNTQNQRALLGSTPNLAGIRNKLAWAQTTNTPGALDHRLSEDIRRFGLGAFSFEVLDMLELTPEMTAAQVRADLDALEQLWRERLDPTLLY